MYHELNAVKYDVDESDSVDDEPYNDQEENAGGRSTAANDSMNDTFVEKYGDD